MPASSSASGAGVQVKDKMGLLLFSVVLIVVAVAAVGGMIAGGWLSTMDGLFLLLVCAIFVIVALVTLKLELRP